MKPVQIAMINDDIVPLEKLDICYLDRGTFFGDGVYETLRSYNGKIFAIDDHLDRLKNSLEAVEIKSIDLDRIRNKITSAFAEAKIPDAKIYLHITRGSAIRWHGGNDFEPNFFLTVMDAPDTAELKANGINVITYPDIRWQKCHIKTLNLLPNVMAVRKAEKNNAKEAIFVDAADRITEGAVSAFFAVIAGRLHTAPLSANILPSVSRKYVLKAAKAIGIEIAEECIPRKKAQQANELFISSTSKNITPVVRFDGTAVSTGLPGPITKALISKFYDFII